MGKKLKFIVRTGLLTTVLVGVFASSTFAHFCYNANKPVGAGAITEEDIKFTKNGKMILPGAFVNPNVWGVEGEYQDVFIRNYLEQAAKNGSLTNGIQEYSVPE